MGLRSNRGKERASRVEDREIGKIVQKAKKQKAKQASLAQDTQGNETRLCRIRSWRRGQALVVTPTGEATADAGMGGGNHGR